MGSRTRLGGGWETCLIAGGVPFYSPAALHSVCQKRNSIVYSPAARNSVNSVMEVKNKESGIKTKPCAFQNGYGASFRRVTPSTQVGRLSGSHSDIGFQLDSIATMGRKVREQKKCMGQQNSIVENCWHFLTIKSAAQLLGTSRFGGKYHEPP